LRGEDHLRKIQEEAWHILEALFASAGS